MFCPNCGTQNPDAAQTCSKCNFHLKSVAAPKFKGTMLMMNQPSVAAPGAAPGHPAAPPGSPGAAPAPAARPAPGTPGGPALPSKLKGTMVGVAPMAGPGRGGPGPVAVPPAGGPYAQPLTPLLAPPNALEAGSAYSPPVPQPGVNPLGGTMAADPGGFAPAPYAPNPAMGAMGGTAIMPQYGGPPPQYGAPQAPQGSPPPYGQQQPPGGAPPYGQQAPYGMPPQGGVPQYGAPSLQGGAPPYGGGAPQYGASPQYAPPYDAPQPGPSSYGSSPPPNPFAAPAAYSATASSSAPPAAGGMVPFGGANPLASLAPGIGRAPMRRNALMTWLLPIAVMVGGSILGGVLAALISPLFGLLGSLAVLAGSVWYLLLGVQMANEVKTVTRNVGFAWWPILVPFYNCYWMWIVVPQEVTRAKQTLGTRAPVRSVVLYVFLWHFALASDLNDMAR